MYVGFSLYANLKRYRVAAATRPREGRALTLSERATELSVLRKVAAALLEYSDALLDSSLRISHVSARVPRDQRVSFP